MESILKTYSNPSIKEVSLIASSAVKVSLVSDTEAFAADFTDPTDPTTLTLIRPELSSLDADTQMAWVEHVRETYPHIGAKEAFRLADQEYESLDGVLPEKE